MKKYTVKDKSCAINRINESERRRIETVGIDLGDRWSRYCGVDENGEVVVEGRVRTGRKFFKAEFAELGEGIRMVIETGTHSPWVDRELTKAGFTVYVANSRKLRLIFKNRKKRDRVDAKYLAKLGQADPDLLHPIQHRGPEAQVDLAVIRTRETVIRSRTKLICCVRNTVKSIGERLPKCAAEAFHRKAVESIPDELSDALAPTIQLIEQLSTQIKGYDRRVLELCEKYPETQRLRAIKGVGPLTALAFVLTIDDSGRFDQSRTVGAFFGLVPASDESGDQNPELRITEEGDELMRRLLVQASHYILGHFGEDCDLKRWGLSLAERGGKIAKRKAVVAVARKLAVLLHRLWVTEVAYDPFYQSRAQSDTPKMAA